jgi:hypothetical protein
VTITSTADEFGMSGGTTVQLLVHSGWFRKKSITSARACAAMVKAAATAAMVVRFRSIIFTFKLRSLASDTDFRNSRANWIFG